MSCLVLMYRQFNVSIEPDFDRYLIFVFLLLVLKLPVVVGGGLLVLLVLGHQVVHVGLGLSELHLVHALASVPVEESLPPEHSGELLGDSLEQLLDGGGVTDEGGGHGKTSGGHITNSNLANIYKFIKRFSLMGFGYPIDHYLNIIRNPLDEI